jgi:hypothetical protein
MSIQVHQFEPTKTKRAEAELETFLNGLVAEGATIISVVPSRHKGLSLGDQHVAEYLIISSTD